MSIKTLRKRIALVAVSALGAGLMSVVVIPSANAAAFAAGGANLNTTDLAASVAGVCQAPTNATDTAIVNRLLVTQSTLTVDVDSNTDDLAADEVAKMTITGPAIWTAVQASTAVGSNGSARTISADSKIATFTADSNGAADGVGSLDFKLTGAGTVEIKTSLTTAAGATTFLDTFTIYSVDACDLGGYDATSSSVTLSTSSSALTAQDTDGDTSGAALRTFSETAYVNLWLADKYGSATASAGNYLTATATNGAIVNWDGAPTAATYSAVTTTSINDAVLHVKNGVSVTAPVTTTVTIALSGTTIATKTIVFSGYPTKINLGTVPAYVNVNGSAADLQSISYTLTDAAGNRVAGTAVAGSTLANTNAGSATNFYTTVNGTSAGGTTVTAAGFFDIVGGPVEGPSTTTIRVLLANGTYLVSAPINYTTTTSTLDSITTSLDKAVYTPGEVVTLTVTGKNAKGNPIADGTAIGSSALSIVKTGLTDAGAAPAAADKSVGGVWTYKFYAATTEAAYGITFKTDAAVTTNGTTVPFTVKVASAGVTNAEVLAAIVKLIASINKQIRALQKSLRR